MFRIIRKKKLNASVTLMEFDAPFIAAKVKAGQFVIFRVDEQGERVPRVDTLAKILKTLGFNLKIA